MKKWIGNSVKIIFLMLIIAQFQSCKLFQQTTAPNQQNTAQEPNITGKSQINIRIPINSKVVYVSGQEITLDSPPAYIDENMTSMVPLRFISDIIGAKVDWIAETKEIKITQENKEIKLQVNNYVALVNLKEFQLKSPPQIKDERTFVPLKFIAENLGFNSDWWPDTKTIILTK